MHRASITQHLLIAILLAAHAGTAYAAEGPFIPIDLGSLAGSFSEAAAINDRGQVVGWSSTASGEEHGFLWTPASGMTDIGDCLPEAVNASGLVVGSRPFTPSYHACTWTQTNGVIDLGTLGGTNSGAFAVNTSGQVVGASTYDVNYIHHAFSWTTEGGIIDLGTLGGIASFAQDVNDSGQVVGASFTPDAYHAFLWTRPEGMIDLGTLGGTMSSAQAVNEGGHVVGTSYTTGNGLFRAFSWTQAGGMIDLGTLGGNNTSGAFAVNDSGLVVGNSGYRQPGGSYTIHAFSWTPTTGMIDLGSLGGDWSSTSILGRQAVSASGQVVGESRTNLFNDDSHAFSWTQAGGMMDLGTLGGTMSWAHAVNASGWVVGASHISRSVVHAVVWRPIADFGCVGTLAGCNLEGANLAGAYLPGRDLTGANLQGTNLARANLSGAKLREVNLNGTNLTNANLARADLKKAKIKDVIWSNTICPDGTNSDAHGVEKCAKHL